MSQYIWLVAAVPLLVLCLAVFAFMASMLRPWMRAVTSGAPVSVVHMLGMRLRGTPPALIVDAFVQLRARGRDVPIHDVERQYIAYKQRIRNVRELVDLVEESLSKEA